MLAVTITKGYYGNILIQGTDSTSIMGPGTDFEPKVDSGVGFAPKPQYPESVED